MLLNTNYLPITAASQVAYKIVDHLGAGGNGEVHLVIATSGPKRGLLFALKLFRRIADPVRRTRFEQEVGLLTELDHPSLLKVVDRGTLAHEQGDFPFAIFEYLPQTLAAALRTGLSMVEKASYTLQLLSALSFLEDRNPQILHRDIKPENIFVRGRSCIIGDFGLIKIIGQEPPVGDREFFLETIGAVMPWAYRTPELVQYGGDNQIELTLKSDIFQLGLVIGEIFSGRNQLKPPQNILDPIDLHPSIFPFGGDFYTQINGLVQQMVIINPEDRPRASELLEPWDGILRDLIDLSIKLEGRAFPH